MTWISDHSFVFAISFVLRFDGTHFALCKSFRPPFSKGGAVEGAEPSSLTAVSESSLRRFFFAKLLRVRYATSVNKLVLRLKSQICFANPNLLRARAAKEKSVIILRYNKKSVIG